MINLCVMRVRDDVVIDHIRLLNILFKLRGKDKNIKIDLCETTFVPLTETS